MSVRPLILVFGVMAMGLLAGCGSGGSSRSATTQSALVPATTSAAGPSAALSPSPITLTSTKASLPTGFRAGKVILGAVPDQQATELGIFVTNTTSAAATIQATIGAFGDDGTALGEGPAATIVIPAGATMPLLTSAIRVPDGSLVANLSIQAEIAEGAPTPTAVTLATSELTALGIDLSTGLEGTVTAKGGSATNVWVGAVCQIADGTIVGAGETQVAAVAPSAQIRITPPVVSLRPIVCRGYAALTPQSTTTPTSVK